MQGPLRRALSKGLGARFWGSRGASSLCSTAMRLVQFCTKGPTSEPRIGLEEKDGGDILDLNALDPSLPKSMLDFLEAGEGALQVAKRAQASGQHDVSRSQVTLLAPITNPEKVICVGLNYMDHCLELQAEIPKEPIIFSKFSSSIVGPYDHIVLPAESNEVDWEVELAFVIGKKGKHIQEADAMSHVAGFTVAHDVSARDWFTERNGKQWLLGKTFDTFCPLGPALVTKDAVSDPHNLGIRCRVNGELVQNSSTKQMILKTEALVAWVSHLYGLVHTKEVKKERNREGRKEGLSPCPQETSSSLGLHQELGFSASHPSSSRKATKWSAKLMNWEPSETKWCEDCVPWTGSEFTHWGTAGIIKKYGIQGG